jgi:hypothetical protein
MNKNCSLGFLEALQLILIVSKMLGLISWSWWLVLAPLWFGLFLLAIVVTVALIADWD